jgi:hypothetical protein
MPKYDMGHSYVKKIIGASSVGGQVDFSAAPTLIPCVYNAFVKKL